MKRACSKAILTWDILLLGHTNQFDDQVMPVLGLGQGNNVLLDLKHPETASVRALHSRLKSRLGGTFLPELT